MSNFRATLAAALTAAAGVAAHGHVEQIVINGVAYQGYDPTSMSYMEDPPTVVGWATTQTDNGFVAPDAYASGDIVCHVDAEPAGGYAEVAAGDSISIQWSEWPESHHGPMIDYLANCNGDCSSVDKTALEFFKIDGSGLVEAGSPGTYGSDTMIKNGNTWLVQIPKSLKAGNYVLRHETIALHSAGQEGGAQNYPQCFNLKVTGSGTDEPAGTLGTKLYTADEAGIEVNIYDASLEYTVPGPELAAIGTASVAQSSVKATATSSATVGSGSGAGAGSGSGSTAAPAEPTTAAAEPTSSVAAPSTSAVASTTAKPTTLSTATRSVSSSVVAAPSTTAAPATTPATGGSGSSGAQSVYGQCGGNNWTGATACASGASCTKYNDYYAQCVPSN
ncbi:carbohydrate-binding module family 1 protein [Xylariomycetidae sp. FL0641]|nr:carbohydrate-binding module family 1 protein [Xylariomycetidae sp. FL0641]